jgi:hypothetical protein
MAGLLFGLPAFGAQPAVCWKVDVEDSGCCGSESIINLSARATVPLCWAPDVGSDHRKVLQSYGWHCEGMGLTTSAVYQDCSARISTDMIAT